MPRIVNHEKLTRKELNALAEEVGIADPDDLERYPNRAAVAQAITRRYAVLDAGEGKAEFQPKAYWAPGPAPVYPNPKIRNAALGPGQAIRPDKGRYVANTRFEQELIENQLVAKGIVFPEDPPEMWDEDNFCLSCNYRPKSAKAMARHYRACHPVTTD